MAWEEYLKITSRRKPRPLLLEALPYVKGKEALDLGCGSLNDAYFLIESGFSVTAVDSNPKVLEYVEAEVNLNIQITTFSDFVFGSNTYDLVSAQYALPFEKPSVFDTTFLKVFQSLKFGGVFVGQLFGTDDGWSHREGMTFLNSEQINSLTAKFKKVHVLREEKKNGPTVTGAEKMWHAFHIIAEK